MRKRERELAGLRRESARFREARRRVQEGEDIEDREGEIEDERNRRKFIGVLKGKKMGAYEGDPRWDDVVPIPQDDGEGALAAIAYTDEYAEGIHSDFLYVSWMLSNAVLQLWATSERSWLRKSTLPGCWTSPSI